MRIQFGLIIKPKYIKCYKRHNVKLTYLTIDKGFNAIALRIVDMPTTLRTVEI